MTETAGAVFLSYASEDAEPAARICAGLRAAGVEVWFDQSELRGGDAWDHHIRSQIRDCALFMPIISAQTQSRPEGYFRLEWDLADQRSHMIVRSKAFIIPVCVDRTSDGGAEVPETFLKVQWTRLPGGETTPAFCERIVKLLQGGEAGRRAQKSPGARAPAPQEKPRSPGLALAAAAVVLIALGWMGWHLLHRQSAALTPPGVPAVPAVAAVPEKSIAVLPFVDLSEKRDQEYFSDGLSEELIDRLSHNPELKVIARTSSFAFKGRNEDIRTIARTLGVANVLEGSVRKSGSALRISAQLIRAADGIDLWSDSFEQQMTDVFKVQQEIAEAVVRGLQAKLLPAALGSNSVPKNMDAYSLYLRGQYFARRASDADAKQAVSTLKQAIALEPDFAPAHAELGDSYLYIATFGSGEPNYLDSCRAETSEALRLDPTLRLARNVRASLETLDWHWADAQKETDQLIASGPSDAASLLRGAGLARALGHMDQALTLYRRGLTLDPLSVLGHVQLSMLLSAMGRPAEARTAAESAIAINPAATKAHLMLAFIEFQAGHLDAASKLLAAESGEYYRLEGEAILAFAKKDVRASDAALAKLIASYGQSAAMQIAQTYAYRGERDKVFEWLNNSIVQKDPGLVYIKTDPMFTNLHGDPRFMAVLHRMGLPLT